jgi:endonuclease/exonuclease/phosphatase (EEP) superfamily protein YafD
MRDGSFAGSTFEDGLWATLFLRIDHVFVPQTWCGADPTRFEIPGSDHRGISVTIGPCPG